MTRRHVRVPLGRFLPPRGEDFVSVEVLSGLILLMATVAALVWANLGGATYESIWSTVVNLGGHSFSLSLRHWINDGLMTVFFFVVGLEIKRELVVGELRDPRRAGLPAMAAIGGMIVPAIIYSVVNIGGTGSAGWGIPMATDIAFAVTVLAVLGSCIPKSLKLFLVTLAIVDDIGAILVIAIFYSGRLELPWITAALVISAVIVVMQRRRVHYASAYLAPALGLWVCMHEAGVHATLAGVALGLLTPARPIAGHEIIGHLENRLHPWSSFAVVPLFALANAGIHVNVPTLNVAGTSRISWGIMLGLVIGKPLGILGLSILAMRTGLGRLPANISRSHILGAGAVAGIGFTVSLFVAELSFGGNMLAQAKLGILAASLISGVIGSAFLLRLCSRTPPPWRIAPPLLCPHQSDPRT